MLVKDRFSEAVHYIINLDKMSKLSLDGDLAIVPNAACNHNLISKGLWMQSFAMRVLMAEAWLCKLCHSVSCIPEWIKSMI